MGPLILSADGAALNTATVEGHIPLPPSPPPPVMAQRYQIVSKGTALSTVPPQGVVWLETRSSDPPTASATARIVQKDLLFHPALLVIQTGTVVAFPNEDEEYHNVFSYSPSKRFDLGRYLPEERPVPTQVFDKPGLVVIRCDIHEHMRALVMVLDSPHFVKTESDGRFRLEGLPPGEFLLKAWIDSQTTLQSPVSLEAGKTTVVSFHPD